MRKLLFTLTIAIFMTGCAAQPSADSESTTLFGRLSEYVQLGSTQETIDYKLPHADYIVSIDGEVLVKRPGEFEITVLDQQTGLPVTGLDVQIAVCQYADGANVEDWLLPDTCDDASQPMTTILTRTTYNGETYQSDQFDWQSDGHWRMMVNIEGADPLQTDLGVYGARPAITTKFELINVFLPFAAIALFVVIVTLRKKPLLRPMTQQEVTA